MIALLVLLLLDFQTNRAQNLNFKAAIRDFCSGHLGAMETSCKHWNTISIELIWWACNLAAAYLHIQWSRICIHLESSFWPLGQCKVQYSLPFNSFFPPFTKSWSKVYRYLAAHVVAVFSCLSFVAGAVSIQWAFSWGKRPITSGSEMKAVKVKQNSKVGNLKNKKWAERR